MTDPKDGTKDRLTAKQPFPDLLSRIIKIIKMQPRQSLPTFTNPGP
jgi:hypothetical protein